MQAAVLRFLCTIAIVGNVALCLLFTSPATASDDPLTPKTRELVLVQTTEKANATTVLVVLGLRNTLNRLVEKAVNEEFGNIEVQLVELRDAAAESYHWPAVDIIITTGRRGCELVLNSWADAPLRCSLLTEQGYRQLLLDTPGLEHRRVSALVVDQPLSRQAVIANQVYPSLSRFSVLSSSNSLAGSSKESNYIDVYNYRNGVPLHTQVSDSLYDHDALIALSDGEIFNRSSLQTVLLTAYGYGKPVVGFSRAYVKAGALISSYSTPTQIVKQLSELVRSGTQGSIEEKQDDSADIPQASVIYPKYFSVQDNPSVARSLGMVKGFEFKVGHSYVDGEFK